MIQNTTVETKCSTFKASHPVQPKGTCILLLLLLQPNWFYKITCVGSLNQDHKLQTTNNKQVQIQGQSWRFGAHDGMRGRRGLKARTSLLPSWGRLQNPNQVPYWASPNVKDASLKGGAHSKFIFGDTCNNHLFSKGVLSL